MASEKGEPVLISSTPRNIEVYPPKYEELDTNGKTISVTQFFDNGMIYTCRYMHYTT